MPMMKAAVAEAYGPHLTIQELEIPDPGPDQILVRVTHCGVCHTDLHAIDGDWPVRANLPLIPGHEAIGFVAKSGLHVKTVKEGDRVGIPWLHHACGSCEYCQTGRESLCPQQLNSGYSVPGGFAEYMLAYAAWVAPIPAAIESGAAAPILCAGVTTYKGLRESEVRAGEWVAIVGAGGLGHLAIEYAKAMGMLVVAIDVDDSKLQLAKMLGADLTCNAAVSDPVEFVHRTVGGVHGVLVTAASPEAFQRSVDLLRPGGTCCLIGLPAGSFPVPIFDVVLKGITIRGSIVGTRNDLREALEFAAAGKVRASYGNRSLEQVNEVFDDMKNGHILGRVVLHMN